MNQDYKNLIVWQKAMELVVLVYQFTSSFPPEEKYGLGNQMRRSAVSIPSNIAEGSRRKEADRNNFLRVSFGSASELETQLEISKRLSYGDKEAIGVIEVLLIEILKMLNKMVNY
jgi:four helix bundle protein